MFNYVLYCSSISKCFNTCTCKCLNISYIFCTLWLKKKSFIKSFLIILNLLTKHETSLNMHLYRNKIKRGNIMIVYNLNVLKVINTWVHCPCDPVLPKILVTWKIGIKYVLCNRFNTFQPLKKGSIKNRSFSHFSKLFIVPLQYSYFNLAPYWSLF